MRRTGENVYIYIIGNADGKRQLYTAAYLKLHNRAGRFYETTGGVYHQNVPKNKFNGHHRRIYPIIFM